MAEKLEAAVGRLLETIRSTPLAQGDESPWCTDGHNGYCWVFIAGNAVVYRCGVPRASSVARVARGEGYRGLFLSDHYAGYGFIAFGAYCLEHLLRDVLQPAEDNPTPPSAPTAPRTSPPRSPRSGNCAADPDESRERILDTLAGNSGANLFDALFGGLDLAIPVLPNGPLTALTPAVLA